MTTTYSINPLTTSKFSLSFHPFFISTHIYIYIYTIRSNRMEQTFQVHLHMVHAHLRTWIRVNGILKSCNWTEIIHVIFLKNTMKLFEQLHLVHLFVQTTRQTTYIAVHKLRSFFLKFRTTYVRVRKLWPSSYFT